METSYTHHQGEAHPIDMVELIAEENDWSFDRLEEDQIAMALEGRWHSYSLTLAWSPYEESLRLIASFRVEIDDAARPKLFEALNLLNDEAWIGALTYWAEEDLIIYRYALMLNGEQMATAEQLDQMIGTAFSTCERAYPAIQLVIGEKDISAESAVNFGIGEVYGHA